MSVRILICLIAANVMFLACNNKSDSSTSGGDTAVVADKNGEFKRLKPAHAKPAWAPEIGDEMAVVIEKLESYGTPPLETLTPVEARKQPTPTNAVMDVMKEHNIPMPPNNTDTAGVDIPVSGGNIHARIYTPKSGDSSYPVIVYYHGGGWVIADLNVYDASAKSLSELTGAVVVSVHYRQGPEHKFPTAHNDAFAAYQWVVKNAANIKGNSKKIAVAGESAGGNLACNVSIMARDKGVTMPVHQLLVYPVANNDMNSASYQKWGTAKPLSKPLIEWMVKNYLSNPAQSSDPRISLVKANLKGLPKTTIIAAEIDLLETEGKLLADKLKEAGVEVGYSLYNGVTHEFFGMASVLPQAKEAQEKATEQLKAAFSK